MPEALSSGDSYVFHYKGNNNPPSKYIDIYSEIRVSKHSRTIFVHIVPHFNTIFALRKQLSLQRR
jgi:hypothetical protein